MLGAASTFFVNIRVFLGVFLGAFGWTVCCPPTPRPFVGLGWDEEGVGVGEAVSGVDSVEAVGCVLEEGPVEAVWVVGTERLPPGELEAVAVSVEAVGREGVVGFLVVLDEDGPVVGVVGVVSFILVVGDEVEVSGARVEGAGLPVMTEGNVGLVVVRWAFCDLSTGSSAMDKGTVGLVLVFVEAVVADV